MPDFKRPKLPVRAMLAQVAAENDRQRIREQFVTGYVAGRKERAFRDRLQVDEAAALTTAEGLWAAHGARYAYLSGMTIYWLGHLAGNSHPDSTVLGRRD